MKVNRKMTNRDGNFGKFWKNFEIFGNLKKILEIFVKILKIYWLFKNFWTFINFWEDFLYVDLPIPLQFNFSFFSEYISNEYRLNREIWPQESTIIEGPSSVVGKFTSYASSRNLIKQNCPEGAVYLVNNIIKQSANIVSLDEHLE